MPHREAKGGITSNTVAMARQGFGLIGKIGEVTKVSDLKGKRLSCLGEPVRSRSALVTLVAV